MNPVLSAAPAEALVCDQCGATFSSEDALDAHRQTHTGTSQTRVSAPTLPQGSHSAPQIIRRDFSRTLSLAAVRQTRQSCLSNTQMLWRCVIFYQGSFSLPMIVFVIKLVAVTNLPNTINL